MGLWEKINGEFKNAVDEGYRAVRDGVVTGGVRLRLHALKRKARGHLAEIGAVVYDMSKTPWENPLSKPEVQRLIAEIKKIEFEAEMLDEELKKAVKADRPGKK